ncbi:MAG: MFS transporter [Methanosarcinales archaeon]
MAKLFKKIKITKNVFFLGMVSLLTDISSEMIIPLLPIFIVSRLGASKQALGLIEGVAESTSSLLKVFSGWYSDQVHKRKPFVLIGYSLSTLTKPFLAISMIWTDVFLLRFTERVGKGLRTAPRDAIIADSTKKTRRGLSYGYHKAMDSSGAILGSILALILFPIFNIRGVFLLSVIPALLAVLVLWHFVEDKPVPIKTNTVGVESFKGFNKRFKYFIVIASIFSLGNISYAFLIIRAMELGIAEKYIPAIYLLFNIVYALFSIPIGVLSDRFNRTYLIIIGYSIFGFICLGFAYSYTVYHIIILFALYGIHRASVKPTMRAFTSDLVSPEVRGTAFGALHTMVGITALPANVIVGILYQYFGAGIAFSYGFVIAMFSAILMMMFVK